MPPMAHHPVAIPAVAGPKKAPQRVATLAKTAAPMEAAAAARQRLKHQSTRSQLRQVNHQRTALLVKAPPRVSRLVSRRVRRAAVKLKARVRLLELNGIQILAVRI